jgi:4-hydroxythreonine-4-phosphate dehydrogenase
MTRCAPPAIRTPGSQSPGSTRTRATAAFSGARRSKSSRLRWSAKAEQIGAAGPYPADTVFVRARDGAFDAVVTMYHDQGQIAMKLLGFERGITILAGLPVPITTPAHGSAFDIAGTGAARVDALHQAYVAACRMACGRRA